VSLPIEYPVLSHSELSGLVNLVSPRLIGSRIERVYVPSVLEHPDGFFKREWALDLYHPSSGSSVLELSLRPKACGIIFHAKRSLKPGSAGTRSGFDLSLHKYLTGGKIVSISTIENDRVVSIEIQNSSLLFSLDLYLIPAKPSGVLTEQNASGGSSLLSSTDQRETYDQPKPRTLTPEALAKIPYRMERISTVEIYEKLWEVAKREDAFFLRKHLLSQTLLIESKTIQKKIASLELQLQESRLSPDWQTFGALLQAHLYQKPRPLNGFYELLDYETNAIRKIPADPKLDLKTQLERFFHLAKRNKKRLLETQERIDSLAEKKTLTDKKLKQVQLATEISELQALEPKKVEGLKGKSREQVSEFSGKHYVSKEGLTILSGRNLTENLQLTFKIARGNDLWFHVKGKPGAHTVVLLPPKRTASLDTLLDAAEVCILHSGGKDWGKTEVDYTYRKFVKKIKNQTDVSYTHNKTLAVTPNPERLKRLFAHDPV